MIKKSERMKFYVVEVVYNDGGNRIRKEAFRSREAAVDFCNEKYKNLANLFKFNVHEVGLAD